MVFTDTHQSCVSFGWGKARKIGPHNVGFLSRNISKNNESGLGQVYAWPLTRFLTFLSLSGLRVIFSVRFSDSHTFKCSIFLENWRFPPFLFASFFADSVDEGEGGRRSWVLEERGTEIKSLRGALGGEKWEVHRWLDEEADEDQWAIIWIAEGGCADIAIGVISSDGGGRGRRR